MWGGGHARYIDTGYDCSGSISFVFAAAGILNTTMTSGELANWGKPGPGKWITVFANNGHTFMYVAGLRFDTVALARPAAGGQTDAANEPDLSSFVRPPSARALRPPSRTVPFSRRRPRLTRRTRAAAR